MHHGGDHVPFDHCLEDCRGLRAGARSLGRAEAGAALPQSGGPRGEEGAGGAQGRPGGTGVDRARGVDRRPRRAGFVVRRVVDDAVPAGTRRVDTGGVAGPVLAACAAVRGDRAVRRFGRRDRCGAFRGARGGRGTRRWCAGGEGAGRRGARVGRRRRRDPAPGAARSAWLRAAGALAGCARSAGWGTGDRAVEPRGVRAAGLFSGAGGADHASGDGRLPGRRPRVGCALRGLGTAVRWADRRGAGRVLLRAPGALVRHGGGTAPPGAGGAGDPARLPVPGLRGPARVGGVRHGPPPRLVRGDQSGGEPVRRAGRPRERSGGEPAGRRGLRLPGLPRRVRGVRRCRSP